MQLRDISKTLFDTCKHLGIQERIVSMLPASTTQLSLLRRRLALAFFLSSPDVLYTDLSSPYASDVVGIIIDRLETNPIFQLDDFTNFAELTALVTILDIGIGPGFSSEPALLMQPLPAPVVSSKTSRFSRINKEIPSDPITAAQTAHNASVDKLADALTKIISRINDRGASHMGRTETKGVLDRVIQRLDLGVRCWPRKRGGRGAWMFDRPSVDHLAQGVTGTLDDFIKTSKRARAPINNTASLEHTAAEADTARAGCSAAAAASSFGEDEFEARAGITA